MIDVHTHLGYHKIYSPSYLNNMVASLGMEPAKLNALVQAFLTDKTGERHLRQMDKAGIDHSVLLIIDSAIGMERPTLSLEEIYELHFKVLKNHPSRFTIFSGIDPRRGDEGYELFLKSVEYYGFRGVKLYPPMGYPMDHPQLLKVYDYCETYGLPVLIHTGDSLNVLDKEYSKVHHALKVVKSYPNIPFILAHAGYQPDQPGMDELSMHPNVYFDIAGIQALFQLSKEELKVVMPIKSLKKVKEKIVFGSDWPLFNMGSSLKQQIEKIKNLLLTVGLNDVEIENVMSAQKLSGRLFKDSII